MSELLEKAFAEAAKLPQQEQDVLANIILAEIAADRHWEKAFAGSADALEKLADEALAEHRAGKAQVLDPEAL